MIFDCEKETHGLYSLLVSAVIPRPIAWVSTCNNDGVRNLAPFSFFNLFAVSPPILGFSPGLKRDRDSGELVKKDTLRNVLANKEFVVNIVNMPLAESMSKSAGEYRAEQSEFDITGLAEAPSLKIKPPRVALAPASFECVLHQTVDLGTSTLVLGKILCVHVQDDLMDGGVIDPIKLQAVGRLGGDFYAAVDNPFTIKRPDR